MPEPTHDNFRDAWDKTTGRKVGKVPNQWFDLFPNLRKTPVEKARERSVNTQATPADNQKEK